ncbi:MAG: MFS transporter [Nitrospirae bacterium]|nr:MFS transporter [Nitrospirota bacterium]
MAILIGMGEKMAERFLPIYLIALGGSIMSIGILNGMNNFLSAIYSFIGGYLSDRFGIKRSLFIFNIVAIIGFLVVIIIPKWQAVLVGAIFFLSWTAISLPATLSLISKVLPMNKRTMGVTMHSLVRRVPMALGPIFGGLCIGMWGELNGVRIAFVFAIIFAIVAIILQMALLDNQIHGKSDDNKKTNPEKNPFKLYKYMDSTLKQLLISDILVRFCEQIPYAFVVIWCMKIIANPVSAFQFGILTSVEMVTAMLIYIPVAYLADKGNKKPFVVITFGFFTLFPLILMFTHSFVFLVIAFIIRGFKEFGEPTRKALIMDISPDHCKAGMFGLYYLLRDIFVSIAAFGGAILWQISPNTNLIAAFLFGLAGTVIFIIWGKDNL